MPAVVSSTDGSYAAGTSERRRHAPVVALLEEREEGLADLVARSSRSSLGRAIVPSRRRARRPSARRPGPGRRRGRSAARARASSVRPAAACAGDGRASGARAVAQLHAVDAGAVAVQRQRRARGTRVRRSSSRGPTMTRVGAPRRCQHVQRLAGAADAEPAALADREAVVAAVAAEHAPARGRRSRRAARRCRRGARGTPRGRCRRGSRGPASRACAATGSPRLGGELAHLAAWSARRAGSAGARATAGASAASM